MTNQEEPFGNEREESKVEGFIMLIERPGVYRGSIVQSSDFTQIHVFTSTDKEY